MSLKRQTLTKVVVQLAEVIILQRTFRLKPITLVVKPLLETTLQANLFILNAVRMKESTVL